MLVGEVATAGVDGDVGHSLTVMLPVDEGHEGGGNVGQASTMTEPADEEQDLL